ncbi:unnamed protein product [Arctogadus glacialis]
MFIVYLRTNHIMTDLLCPLPGTTLSIGAYKSLGIGPPPPYPTILLKTTIHGQYYRAKSFSNRAIRSHT